VRFLFMCLEVAKLSIKNFKIIPCDFENIFQKSSGVIIAIYPIYSFPLKSVTFSVRFVLDLKEIYAYFSRFLRKNAKTSDFVIPRNGVHKYIFNNTLFKNIHNDGCNNPIFCPLQTHTSPLICDLEFPSPIIQVTVHYTR
jgi:hypothetical protein